MYIMEIDKEKTKMRRNTKTQTFTGYDADKLAENFANAYVDSNGVVRWKSNDRVPFEDMVTDFAEAGFVGKSAITLSELARQADTSAFLAEYATAQANRTPEQIAEEQFEMQAAFGPGVEVVNVFTGQKTTT